jgi:hypothetical protein
MSLNLAHVLYLIKGAAAAVAAGLVLRVRIKPAVVWTLAVITGALALGVLYSVLHSMTLDYRAGIDYRIFRAIGADVWAGADPYADDRFFEHPFLNPPSSLPLFAAFDLLPLRAGFLVWGALNLLGCAALVPLARPALAAQERLDGALVGRICNPSGRIANPSHEQGPEPPWLPPEIVVVALSCALVASDATLIVMVLGQMSVLAAVALVAALAAQARGRPTAAGVLLALATVKVATMLPFLLLFLRRADWRAWAALAVTTLALCLAAVPPAELPGRLATLLERSRQLQAPGQVNDYSFEGTQSENILGFEHALYRLGLRDGTTIRLAQYAAVLLLGAWVARQVLGRGRLPRAAACSLVALYSTVFLYHRAYDTVILALPLVYSAGRARLANGPARWLFAGCAVAILLVLNLNVTLLRSLTHLSLEWGGWGRVVQAVVLPYATWLILLAMLLLVRGARAKEGRWLPAPA